MTAFLRKVRWREIDHDPPRGQGQAKTSKGGADAFAAFADGLIAQADNDEKRLAAGHLDLDINPPGLNPLKRDRYNARNHGKTPPLIHRVRRFFGSRQEHIMNKK